MAFSNMVGQAFGGGKTGEMGPDLTHQGWVMATHHLGPIVNGLVGGIVAQKAHFQKGKSLFFDQLFPVEIKNVAVGLVAVQAGQGKTGLAQAHRQINFTVFHQLPFAGPDLQMLPEMSKGLTGEHGLAVGHEGGL